MAGTRAKPCGREIIITVANEASNKDMHRSAGSAVDGVLPVPLPALGDVRR